jgi:hypothetical protein
MGEGAKHTTAQHLATDTRNHDARSAEDPPATREIDHVESP